STAALSWPAAALTAGASSAEGPCQHAVFAPNPAGDEERVNEMPEEVDHQSDDRQREHELSYGDAGAPEIEIVRAEVTKEEPQRIGCADILLVRLEHHHGARVGAEAGSRRVHRRCRDGIRHIQGTHRNLPVKRDLRGRKTLSASFAFSPHA